LGFTQRCAESRRAQAYFDDQLDPLSAMDIDANAPPAFHARIARALVTIKIKME
jgi:hypothetical protein